MVDEHRQQTGLILRLRYGLVFPWVRPSLPNEVVSLSAPSRGVARRGTRSPLSPHCNPPSAPGWDSLGAFHNSLTVPYPLLQPWFQGAIAGLPWPGRSWVDPLSRHAHARQATPRTAFTAPGRVAPQHGFKPESYTGRFTTRGVRPRTRSGLHGGRGRCPMPLGNALPPQARSVSRASHQHPPQTGRKKQAPGVSQICPFKDF